MNKIIMVGGGKGGVGKSTVVFSVVDFLLTKNEKVLAESSAALMRPRTDVALTYKGFSTPDAVRVAITKADGTVLAEKTTPYASPFEKKAGITFGWGALIVLAIIVIGYIVSLLRRRV